MDGEETRIFARDCHSFTERDRQCGKNWMAMTNKVLFLVVLNDFIRLMGGLEGNFEPNISYGGLIGSARQQVLGVSV